MQLLIAAALLAARGARAQTPCAVAVDTSSAAASIPSTFAGFGWEMYAMLGSMAHLADPRFARAAGGLAPALLRVGGITGDWVRYLIDAPPEASVNVEAGAAYWPTEPKNLTARGDFAALINFARDANFSLMFMLNELYGRNCSATKPGCASCTDWCVGDWDTSNVRAFLQYIHDEGLFGGSNALQSFELGNELVSHMFANDTVADIKLLAGIIESIWADVPSAQRPRLFAPSTDACTDPAQLEIMANISGVAGVGGFTFRESALRLPARAPHASLPAIPAARQTNPVQTRIPGRAGRAATRSRRCSSIRRGCARASCAGRRRPSASPRGARARARPASSSS